MRDRLSAKSWEYVREGESDGVNVCERGTEDSGEVGTDSEIEEGQRLECKEGGKKRDKNWDSSKGVETPGCMITWVVHVVHLALAGELLVSNAPFCCGETWLALVNRLQHTPLSAQVSLQALRFLSPRATPQPLRGETTTTGNSLPSSASSSDTPLSLWSNNTSGTLSLQGCYSPGAVLQSGPNTV